MLNVNAITSTLARMPDAALQKYAALHKEDPYIMALAVSESNRRKQMRNAAQAPQGMPEPPKVVDQDIAEMAPQMQSLPEEQGIARLPTGDMNFAGGGIIAFGDGGDVEHYDGGGFLGDFYGAESPVERARRLRLEAEAQARARARATSLGTTFEQERARNMATVADQGFVRTDPRAAQFSIPTIAEQVTGASPTLAEPTPAPTPAPTARAPGAGAPRANAPAPAAQTAAPELDYDKLMKAATKATDRPSPYAADIEALGKERVKAREEDVAGLKAIQEKFSDIYKGRKERLDTREAELGKMKDHHTGLALLQAGAAMMSTPGGLSRALGKGVQVGSEQYGAGMEKLQAAKDKLSEARDRLEEVEAQRGEMSARELLKANGEITNAKLGAREDLIKANMEWGKITREEATKRVDAQLRTNLGMYEQQQQNLRTDKTVAGQLAAAARNPQLELLRAVQKDPALAQTYQVMHGTKNDLMSQYTDFVKTNPTATLEDFLRARAVFSTLGAGAPRPVTNPPAGAVAPRAP